MFEGANMQTTFLKDFVTPVDPTNPYSFMNYLVKKGWFYQFLNTNRRTITRREFELYAEWISVEMVRKEKLIFNEEVVSVDFNEIENLFYVKSVTGKIFKCVNICLGTGVSAKSNSNLQLMHQKYPDQVMGPFDQEFLNLNVDDKNVTIVGGGQTGLEIFEHLLQPNCRWGQAKNVKLISRRPNLEPLDESPFTNEYFHPHYSKIFAQWNQSTREETLLRQKLISDGNTPSFLEKLYQDLYLKSITPQKSWGPQTNIYLGQELREVSFEFDQLNLATIHQKSQQKITHKTDILIYCLGIEVKIPKLMDQLKDRLELNGASSFHLGSNYEFLWKEEFNESSHEKDRGKIYGVNFGRNSHGIADPQTSLMSHRSGVILQDILNVKCRCRDEKIIFYQPETLQGPLVHF
jgi:lysine N6-hydroxylase